MGAWGPALYSDDVAEDVRSEYTKMVLGIRFRGLLENPNSLSF